MTTEELRAQFLLWRGVRTPCNRCGGSGVRGYANGATWRGGAGVSVVTRDVCDLCWGSGDADRPFENRKAREDAVKTEVERRAADLFTRACGVGFIRDRRPGSGELAGELERMSKGRKPRAAGFYETCARLAAVLRRAATEPVAPEPEVPAR
jgi:hypothetical protein